MTHGVSDGGGGVIRELTGENTGSVFLRKKGGKKEERKKGV